ncbi:glycerophosphodiester phosphodiesterase [Methanobacterium sp.]|uniref:glycerophosphodiester phosphodiesterase n=1 Tax=Methanobacterium sp. TaxID=2164 RepID=UPI003C73D7C2
MQVIAHRGASFFEPENTIRAIEKAIKMGAGFVEVDVRKSKDNELVIMHDPDVNRTTNGNGFVKDYTLQELKELDADQGETIPTLDEVISCVKDRIGLVIEIKEPGTEGKILEKINENNLENIILTSFYHKSIKNARKINSSIDAGIIFACQPVDINQMALNASANIIFPSYKYLDEDLIKQAHKNEISVYPWTIDDDRIFEKLVEMNVDGIVTNKLIEKDKKEI